MKRIGLITEFNPLHEGHKHYINTVQEKYPDSEIVVVMSGNVVQRGEFAITDKFTRAEAALNLGVDLVVELPAYYSLNNANIFAKGSIKVLEKFGVEGIVFGSESNDVNKLEEVAIKMNDDSFQALLKEEVKKVQSFPKAFESLIGIEFKSNDILGVTYISEILKSKNGMSYETIQRDKKYISGSANRVKIKEGNNVSLIDIEKPVDMNDFFDIIKAKILTDDIDNDTVKYVKRYLESENISSWDDMTSVVSNKSFTKAKISREVLKWYLSIENFKGDIRVLAASDRGFTTLKEVEGYTTRYNPEDETTTRIARMISVIHPEYWDKEFKTSVIKK